MRTGSGWHSARSTAIASAITASMRLEECRPPTPNVRGHVQTFDIITIDMRFLQAASFGERVRALRLSQGVSLRRLAARADCSASGLSAVERGLVVPSIALAERLALLLDTSLAELLEEPHGTPGPTHLPTIEPPNSIAEEATQCW